jgi:hypothetical protein
MPKMSDEEKIEVLKTLFGKTIDPKIIKEGKERICTIFIPCISTPIFLRAYNLQRQFKVEMEFHENVVENPEKRKVNLSQYLV